MAAEEILMELFDQNWFFSRHKETQRSNEESVVVIEESEDPEKPRPSKIPQEEEEVSTPANVLVGRSMSDQNLMSSKTSSFGSSEDLFSPTSVLNVKPQMGKLQTILSGKEVREFLLEDNRSKPEKVSDAAEEKKKKKNKKKKHEVERERRRKSLSDLECQELKGFMDLGFVFSDEDHKDSVLVSILPGLQRLGRKNSDETEENRGGGDGEEEKKKPKNRVGRPYLSEAWESWEERKEKKSRAVAAMKWKFPAPANEVDIKDNLKLWAHTVASTVR